MAATGAIAALKKRKKRKMKKETKEEEKGMPVTRVNNIVQFWHHIA